MTPRGAQAVIRFGLGRRGAEALPTDPEAWLLRQLEPAAGGTVDPAATSAAGMLAVREDRRTRPPPGEARAQALFRAQGFTQVAHAVSTPHPFRERLVWFWANHFTVSLRRGECAALAGAFVEEAIRPHVTGPFADMVLAVMRHPAMLLYLDNVGSIGPDSQVGQRLRRGLNENLARECLELHTVTPAAGYTQDDVTAMARVLTGWSLDFQAENPGFRFRSGAHQPGEQTVLGRRLAPAEAGGIEALRFLATHPATYRALATKLVRHFAADNPPPDAVRRVAAVLHDTEGHLGAAAAALVRLEDAWVPETKFRTPQDHVIACFRALDVAPEPPPNFIGILGSLGQPLWTAPAPNGWPDRAVDWSTPEALMRRIDWANSFAGARLGTQDPADIAECALGPRWRAATREAMSRAGSRRDALTMLLVSPEFLRR